MQLRTNVRIRIAIRPLLFALFITLLVAPAHAQNPQKRVPNWGGSVKAGTYFLMQQKESEGHAGRATSLLELELLYTGAPFYRPSPPPANDSPLNFPETSPVEGNIFNGLRLSVGVPLDNPTKTRILPITLGQVYQTAPTRQKVSAFLGYGVGLYLTRIKNPSGVSKEDVNASDEKNRPLLGGYASAGVQSGTLLLEVKYHLISHYQRRNVNGLQLALGVRF